MNLLIATQNGFLTAAKSADGWQTTQHSLNGRFLTTLTARDDVIFVGAQGGLLRSDDGGDTWREAERGLHHTHVRWLTTHPDRAELLFAGTEPAALYVSQDGGTSWEERPQIGEWRDQFGWWLPYSPEAGCVRGFACRGARIYAAVEVGAALRSDDYGDTWRLVGGSNGRPQFGTPPKDALHPDVHSIAVHTAAPELVLAPTGGGFYLSRDGGATWTHQYGRYVRAVWANPVDPDHLIIGPADNASGQNGHITETRDGGSTWHTISNTWRSNMVERFWQAGDHLFAVMAGGQLLATLLSDMDWQPILPSLPHVTAVATV